MPTRRICITIKSFISWQSIPLYSQSWYVIPRCYSEEKSDPSDSYSILLFLYNISLFIHFYMNILLIMVIELSRVHSARSIWNHKYDFRPKLHGTRFNYQFIISILKSPKYRTWSVQKFYWCSTELVWN